MRRPSRVNKTGMSFLHNTGGGGLKQSDNDKNKKGLAPTVKRSRDKLSIGLNIGGSAQKTKKSRGRSGVARPSLKIDTNDGLAFGGQNLGDELNSPNHLGIQPLQSARSKLQSADKKDLLRDDSNEDKSRGKDNSSLKGKKVGQTPKTRGFMKKGLSLFK